MMHPQHNAEGESSGGCDKCVVVKSVERSADEAGLGGWRLVFSSTLVFLLPIVMAIAGATVSREGQSQQLAGAVGGFVLGIVLALIGTRLIRPPTTTK